MTGSERGFTIIEVILFLAITGGLFAALMIGVNVGVTQQRYLDSVRSYKALLQDQYIAAINTRNDDNQNVKCKNPADGSIQDNGTGSNVRTGVDRRGASTCVILGRAIQLKVQDGATQVVTSSVTGYDPGNLPDNTSDNTALLSYQPKLADFDQQTSLMEWDAKLTRAVVQEDAQQDAQEDVREREPSTAVILILRSPASGSITVYTSNEALGGDLVDLAPLFDISQPHNTELVKSCVEGDSGLLPKQMIVINPKTAGPDAVSSDGGSNEVCQ